MASQGDPRVLAVLNLLLSLLFSYVAARALAFVDVVAFTWRTVLLGAALLFAVTWVVVMR